jgi:hypothetical protein
MSDSQSTTSTKHTSSIPKSSLEATTDENPSSNEPTLNTATEESKESGGSQTSGTTGLDRANGPEIFVSRLDLLDANVPIPEVTKDTVYVQAILKALLAETELWYASKEITEAKRRE